MSESDSISYREWEISEIEQGRTGIFSPYGALTRVADFPVSETEEKAKEWIDETIRRHYPPRRTGRYGPPLSKTPAPGQFRGVRFDRNVPMEDEA